MGEKNSSSVISFCISLHLPVSTRPIKNSAITDTVQRVHKPVVNGISIKNSPIKKDIKAIYTY